MIVIYSLFAGLAMYCIKSRVCPKSWQPPRHSQAGSQKIALAQVREFRDSDEEEEQDKATSSQPARTYKLNDLHAEFTLFI